MLSCSTFHVSVLLFRCFIEQINDDDADADDDDDDDDEKWIEDIKEDCTELGIPSEKLQNWLEMEIVGGWGNTVRGHGLDWRAETVVVA